MYIDINGTGAMRLPLGTTAQRPTVAEGIERGNSTLTEPNTDGTKWVRYSTTTTPTISATRQHGHRSNGRHNAG